MNLFYKIHLQAFNVISIVLYYSSPTYGQVLYCCQDAFVFDASDYSGHLIRHLLNASEAFSTEWFLQFWEQVKGWWAHVRTVRRVGWHLPSVLLQNFRYCTWGMRSRVVVQNDTSRELRGLFFLANLWTQNVHWIFCPQLYVVWYPILLRAFGSDVTFVLKILFLCRSWFCPCWNRWIEFLQLKALSRPIFVQLLT